MAYPAWPLVNLTNMVGRGACIGGVRLWWCGVPGWMVMVSDRHGGGQGGVRQSHPTPCPVRAIFVVTLTFIYYFATKITKRSNQTLGY
jgi:hypothetical protein